MAEFAKRYASTLGAPRRGRLPGVLRPAEAAPAALVAARRVRAPPVRGGSALARRPDRRALDRRRRAARRRGRAQRARERGALREADGGRRHARAPPARRDRRSSCAGCSGALPFTSLAVNKLVREVGAEGARPDAADHARRAGADAPERRHDPRRVHAQGLRRGGQARVSTTRPRCSSPGCSRAATRPTTSERLAEAARAAPRRATSSATSTSWKRFLDDLKVDMQASGGAMGGLQDLTRGEPSPYERLFQAVAQNTRIGGMSGALDKAGEGLMAKLAKTMGPKSATVNAAAGATAAARRPRGRPRRGRARVRRAGGVRGRSRRLTAAAGAATGSGGRRRSGRSRSTSTSSSSPSSATRSGRRSTGPTRAARRRHPDRAHPGPRAHRLRRDRVAPAPPGAALAADRLREPGVGARGRGGRGDRSGARPSPSRSGGPSPGATRSTATAPTRRSPTSPSSSGRAAWSGASTTASLNTDIERVGAGVQVRQAPRRGERVPRRPARLPHPRAGRDHRALPGRRHRARGAAVGEGAPDARGRGRLRRDRRPEVRLPQRPRGVAPVTWPMQGKNPGASIRVRSASGREEVVQQDGEWGLYRLIESGAVKRGPERARLHRDLEPALARHRGDGRRPRLAHRLAVLRGPARQEAGRADRAVPRRRLAAGQHRQGRRGMQLGLGRARPARAPIGVFGKLPAHGDFFRLNVAEPVAQALVAWLQEAIGPVYQARLALAPAVRFLLRAPQAQAALVGVMVPSVDKVGRTFPLAVYAHVAPAAAPEAFPPSRRSARASSTPRSRCSARPAAGDGPSLGAKVANLPPARRASSRPPARPLAAEADAEQAARSRPGCSPTRPRSPLSHALTTLAARRARCAAGSRTAQRSRSISRRRGRGWLALARARSGSPRLEAAAHVLLDRGRRGRARRLARAPGPGLLAYLADRSPAPADGVVARREPPPAIEAVARKATAGARWVLDSTAPR